MNVYERIYVHTTNNIFKLHCKWPCTESVQSAKRSPEYTMNTVKESRYNSVITTRTISKQETLAVAIYIHGLQLSTEVLSFFEWRET